MNLVRDLQNAVVARLSEPGKLTTGVKVHAYNPKDLGGKQAAELALQGLTIYVWPPLPTSAMQGVPEMFFDRVEVKLSLIEKVAKNRLGIDAYELVYEVATALHWWKPEMVAHPLYMARDFADDFPIDENTLGVDLRFHTAFGILRQP